MSIRKKTVSHIFLKKVFSVSQQWFWDLTWPFINFSILTMTWLPQNLLHLLILNFLGPNSHVKSDFCFCLSLSVWISCGFAYVLALMIANVLIKRPCNYVQSPPALAFLKANLPCRRTVRAYLLVTFSLCDCFNYEIWHCAQGSTFSL